MRNMRVKLATGRKLPWTKVIQYLAIQACLAACLYSLCAIIASSLVWLSVYSISDCQVVGVSPPSMTLPHLQAGSVGWWVREPRWNGRHVLARGAISVWKVFVWRWCCSTEVCCVIVMGCSQILWFGVKCLLKASQNFLENGCPGWCSCGCVLLPVHIKCTLLALAATPLQRTWLNGRWWRPCT